MQKSLDKIEKPFPFRHQSNIALDTFQTMILKKRQETTNFPLLQDISASLFWKQQVLN